MHQTAKTVIAAILLLSVAGRNGQAAEPLTSVPLTSLDGQWLLATDPDNVGRERQWQTAPRPEAKPAKVPWIIQGTFPGYHGVAWYWREFAAPANAYVGGRYLLRFWAVDYLAEVWINGVHVGGHEGGETPFVLDVTDAVKPQEENLLAVRVLNPTHEPIDGIVLNQTAHRCKVIPYRAGAAFNHGGIVDSVELLAVPAVRVEDLFVRPDVQTGVIRVRVNVRNALEVTEDGRLELSVAPAASGKTLDLVRLERKFPAGDTRIEAELRVDNPRLWNLDNPFLYRVTARVEAARSGAFDEHSTRSGFRDFRFADGAFRLNGRRIYLRGSHTCNHYPIGLQFPHEGDLLRRDLVNMKVMGFNAVRFIWGGAARVQLDLCDEIGLMVYEESYAAWPIAEGPKMAERFDRSVEELIRRDRNHPSVVIWGLLNEAPDGAAFHHAVGMLPRVRELDDTRVVMLNSGRYDRPRGGSGIGGVAGLDIWPRVSPGEPWVARNRTDRVIEVLGITWPAGALALHPGPQGQYSAVRWTAPADGEVEISATFTGIAERATTDVHVLHNRRPLFDAHINLHEQGNSAVFSKSLHARAGDTIDCVVGFGNKHYGADSTALSVTVRSAAGERYDATADFRAEAEPPGPWSYGKLSPGSVPDAATFVSYGQTPGADRPAGSVGSIANPECTEWQDLADDRHFYPRVPHTADVIEDLRTIRAGGQPVFLSEYGIGSAVDLWRAVRHYEQHGAERLEDARFLQDKLDRFLADWRQWSLDDTFARPEDFFMASLRKMAGQRTLGLNAIRSNANVVGHSLTGAVDHVMCGEGLTTLFRELKPGTIDAMFDAWAPLRWCLFAEPCHVVRGSAVRLEAVLANEDVLSPGEYPVRLEVVGPRMTRVLDRTITVTIPEQESDAELPLAQACFAEDVVVDGPQGKYRFLATFENKAAAAGGGCDFYVTDPALMPPVEAEIVLWGEDPKLAEWLAGRGIRSRPFSPERPAAREVILVAGKPKAPPEAEAFPELVERIKRGASVVFLTPDVFAKGDQPLGWLPLANKGDRVTIRGWLYLKDEWAKRHPIFDGLQAGGLMDYTFYREIIPDVVLSGQDPPAEAVAGAVKASQDYSSGLTVAVYDLGAGRFILNTLRIRDNLGRHPAAERILRNMLNYAAHNTSEPLVDGH